MQQRLNGSRANTIPLPRWPKHWGIRQGLPSLAQATVSQHLKELKNAGLIKGSIEGNAVCYCIDEKAISRLQTYFANISVKLAKKKTDCC